jgi:zinc transport system substrate-binding protein
MNARLTYSLIVGYTAFLLALGLGLPLSSMAGNRVFVSVLPQKYFVEKIGGGAVDVEVMVQPGASPATYEPKPSQMRKLAGSAAYFAIGVPFEEAWLDRIAGVNPNMAIVHTSEGIKRLSMATHQHDEEREETGHQEKRSHNEHDGLDPHIWLAPALVKKQVVVIRDTLARLYPGRAAEFSKNHDAFITEIDRLDGELRLILEEKRGMQFMVFHPSWGYFAEEYGLEQVAIELEGKAPKPSQLSELIRHAKKENITVIFAQPQFSIKSAALIAREIGGEVILADPLAENWLQNMTAVAEKFRKAIH